jgi:hypothetical protein
MIESGFLTPTGTWEVTITRADLLAAKPPPDPGEDQPGNYGHGTIDFHGGEWVLNPPPGQQGTFSITGNEITLEATNGEEFKATWSIYRDTLTFGVGVPTPWRVKPWHRVTG